MQPRFGYCLITPDLSLATASRTESLIERRYAERMMKQRLHQPVFRARATYFNFDTKVTQSVRPTQQPRTDPTKNDHHPYFTLRLAPTPLFRVSSNYPLLHPPTNNFCYRIGTGIQSNDRSGSLHSPLWLKTK